MRDGSQNTGWWAHYRPFGEATTAGSATLDLRLPGQWFQMETGLSWNWHRTYDPSLGRYLQPDPLGLTDGSSVYGYAHQSPMMGIDPEGSASISLPMIGPPSGALELPGRQIRIYNKFGEPFCDIDLIQDHGAGLPHLHFWMGTTRLGGIPVPP